MKKLLVNTSDNLKINQDKLFLSLGAESDSIVLQKSSHVRLHIKGHLKNQSGESLYTVWTVSSLLFGHNIYLRGVEEVADGWQVILDCTEVGGGALKFTNKDTILVGRVMESVLLHRVGSDVAANGARILG